MAESIIITALYMILLISVAPRNNWVYRNPANRTCKKCGQVQNLFELPSFHGQKRIYRWENMGDARSCKYHE